MSAAENAANWSTWSPVGDVEYRLVAVDLFCGGGGFTTGFVRAVVDRFRETIAAETGLAPDDVAREHGRVQRWLGENVYLVGVNHCDDAVETFRANHPWARCLNARVQAVFPPDAVTVETAAGEERTLPVDVVIAGPSCVPWSKAKGGMASDDQDRMSPEHVKRWLYLLRPQQFILENVPGFENWGPLYRDDDGELRMRKDGSMFEDWRTSLETMGYSVAYRKLVAADYGDPQTRRRLFVQGRLEYEPRFPEPTHSADGAGDTEPHRTAAEAIDEMNVGESLWMKPHPLKWKTMRRIAQGIREFCHDRLDPYADALDWIGRVEPGDDVDAADFQNPVDMREAAVPVEEAAEAAQERDEPFLVEGPVYAGPVCGEPVGDDVTALCVPQVMGGHGGATPRDATETPVSTVTAGGCIHYVDPEVLVLPRNGRARDEYSNPAYDPSTKPLHTVTAQNHDGRKFDACLVPLYSERDGQAPRTRDTDRPLMTVPASKSPAGVSQPFLVKYYGNSDVEPLDEPVDTVTTRDTFALCVPECYPWGLDVHYRMLQPRELARAQGFPDSYEFTPETKKSKTKLIGNAVPVGLAESLISSLLAPTDAPTLNQYAAEPPQPAADPTEGDD